MIDKRLAELVASDVQLAEKDRLIAILQGRWRGAQPTLLALAPELGQASRREIARLPGLAPYDHEPASSESRSIWGGRSEVRGMLYMAAPDRLPAAIPVLSLHQRLCDAGRSEGRAHSPSLARS